MKKIVSSTVAALAVAATVSAADAKDTALLTGGKVTGQIKAMQILNDKTNTFTPREGSAYLGKLKYVTPDLKVTGLKAGAAFYINGDTGLTDWDDANKKKAQGLFTGNNLGDTATLLGEAYLEYNSEMVDAKVGRQILNTPLTTIKWSLMPNFYEAGVLTVKPMKNLSVTLAQVTGISFGSRSAADWGLIGEKTKTAGVATPRLQQSPSGVSQAKFLNLGTAAGVAETDGITVASVGFQPMNNLALSAWYYMADNIAEMTYLDANYGMKVSEGTKLSLAAQYLAEDDEGSKLAGALDYSMYGIKAQIGSKKWSAYAAFNQSDSTASTATGQFINPFGADPAYTSSLFSRNAYRDDVTAYKVGGHFVIMKGLKIMASYANYGKSKTNGWGSLTAAKDAEETDIVIGYKPPVAGLTLKLMNAFRTSEFDGVNGVEREMGHTRFIADYQF